MVSGRSRGLPSAVRRAAHGRAAPRLGCRCRCGGWCRASWSVSVSSVSAGGSEGPRRRPGAGGWRARPRGGAVPDLDPVAGAEQEHLGALVADAGVVAEVGRAARCGPGRRGSRPPCPPGSRGACPAATSPARSWARSVSRDGRDSCGASTGPGQSTQNVSLPPSANWSRQRARRQDHPELVVEGAGWRPERSS